MKNLYARLTQAPLNAPIIHTPGIAGNTSFPDDTSTEYPFSKNQTRKKLRLVTGLATALLLFLLPFSGKAQAPIFEKDWLAFNNTDYKGFTGSVFDGNNNFYAIYAKNGVTNNSPRIVRKRNTGTVDSAWVIMPDGEPGNLVINKVKNTLFYQFTNSGHDSLFVGQITNISTTPVNNTRWKFVRKIANPNSSYFHWQVPILVPMLIDNSDNIFITEANKIYKVPQTGPVDLNWCTITNQTASNDKRVVDIKIDQNDNLYAIRTTTANDPNNAAKYVSYITKITPAGVADTLWFNLSALNDPNRFLNDYGPRSFAISGDHLYTAYSDGVVPVYLPHVEKVYFAKVNLTNKTKTLIDSSFGINNIIFTARNMEVVAAPNGDAYYTNITQYNSDTIRIYKASGTTNSVSLYAKLSNSNYRYSFFSTSGYEYKGRDFKFDNNNKLVMQIDSLNPDPFAFMSGLGNFHRFALITPTLDVNFIQTQPTCANSTNGGLRAIATGGSGYSYLWTPGGASTDSIGNLAPGTYSVRVISGTDTINKSVTLVESNIVSAPSAGNQTLCNGATVADLVATAASGNTIVWYTTATGGAALPNSTPLVNGAKYFAAQVTPSNCESGIRAADSVTIAGSVQPINDTAFCNSNTAAINFMGAAGNSYNWTATQNGTGIPASGTGNISFTAGNNTNSVIKDTVMVAAGYTSPYSYTISDGTYAFADTTGSTYLNLSTEYSAGNLSSSKPIGFNFNFFGTTYSNIYISNAGSVAFDAAATKLVYGQLRDTWKKDASSKIAYKTTGTAPNRKLIVSFIDFTKPDNITITMPFGPPIITSFTADPTTGRGTFQIVLNETSNTIESLKQSVPSLTAFTIPIGGGPSGTIAGNYEGVKNGTNQFYVSGRENGDWLKLTNESKIFTPIAGFNCSGNKDTFLISVNPLPKLDSVPNQQVCPGGTASAINFTTPITGGTVGYKWTNSNTAIGLAASGNGNIPSFTAAATGSATITVMPYMLKSATDTCFGTARTFTITADLPPAPTTTGSLVVYTGSKTISQLDVTPLTGGAVNYYYTATGGTALAGTTAVVDDTTYYVSQTVNGCESTPRKQIKVNRIANDSIVLCNPATVVDLTATPQTGNPVRWYDVPSGGTALSNSPAFSVGTDTLYVEEGFAVPVSTANYFYTMPNNPGSVLWNMTYGANDTIYFLERTGTSPTITNNIYKIKADGTGKTLVYSVANPNDGRLLYIDSSGTKYLYFAQTNSLKKINLSTNIVTNNTLGGSITPGDLEYDPVNKVIYFGDTKTIYKFNTTTGVTSSVYTASSTPGIAFISGLTYVQSSVPGSSGKIFFGEQFAGVYFLELTSTPTLTQFLPSGGAGTYNAVEDIDMLPNGTLLVGRGDMILNINQSGVVLDTLFNAAIADGTGMNISFGIKSDSVAYFSVLRSDPGSLYKLTIQQPNVSNRLPVTVIVNPTPNVLPTADTTVCNGSATPAINFATTTTGGTVTYNWTNDNTNIGLAASGSGNIASFVATNPSTTPLAQTATIIVTPTITNAGITCEGVKDTFLITVNPTLVVPVIASQVTCNGAPTTTVSFGGIRDRAFSITYNWTNNTPSIGLAAGGTGNIPSFTAINNGNAPVTATITVTPNYTNNGVSCIGTPRTFTITVNPTATVDTIANKIVCNGANTTAINFSSATSGGTIVYDWTNSNTNIGLATSGTGDIASFVATNTGTTPDTATITVTPTFTNAGKTCIGTPRTFSIIVNPTATVNAISNKVACNGATVAAVTPSSPNTGGTITYAWVNNNTAIGLAASGTGTIPGFTATNTGTSPATATITITPTFTNGGVSCTGTAQTYTITVNPTAVVNTVSNQVLCNGSSTAAINFGNNTTGGTVTYAWTNTNTSVGLAASGSGNIASFTAVNNGTAPATATITVTPTYTNAGVSCQGTAQTFTITVNPTALVNTISNKVVCNGSSIAAINFGTTATGGTVTYSWTNNNTSFGLAASGNGNIASFNAVNNSNAPQTATITVTPVFSNGGVSCTGTSTSFTITVNPEVTVNTIASQVLCNNATTAAVNFTSPATGGSIVYNWTNSNTAIGLPAGGSGNIASFTATNNTNAPLTATITVIATYSNAGISCSSAPQTFVYTVNPTATVNAISNQTLCNGAAVTAVNFTSPTTGGAIVYNWTNNTPSIGLAASGSGNIAAFNAINNSNAPITVTITVTPTFSNGGVSCTGTPQSFTITVNPTAVVNAVSNQTVCADVTNNAVSFSSPVAGTFYNWINSNPSIGLAASGTGTVPSFTAVNASPNATSATITVTPNTAAGCIGQPITYTITVNGKSVAPVSVINPTPIVCANNAFATLSVNGGALGSGATWKWYADSLNTVSIGSGAILSNIAVAKTTTYFVRAEGTCNNTAAASVVVQRANLVHQVRQHWNDVLLFDNSSNNYVAWQWYKNGVAVAGATLQQYSESSSLVGIYYVVATDKNGVQFISCPLTIAAGSFTGLKISLFPNPADKGANVTISTSFTASELQGASITVTDVYGRVIRQIAQVTPNTAIEAPTATGMYIVTLTLQNGMKYSANLLTK